MCSCTGLETGSVCVCVYATGITGMYRTGLEVCVNTQKYLTKQVRLMLAGWRAQVGEFARKKQREAYKQLHVSTICGR